MSIERILDPLFGMKTDHEIRRLYRIMQTEKDLSLASARAGMDPKTARRYLRTGKLPSELQRPHDWRTRKDPFTGIRTEVEEYLCENPGLEAKTLFEHFREQYPDRFTEGQLRTFQRRVKLWRVTRGPSKEVYFPQDYSPAERCQSDFTSMNGLNVTIDGQAFKHLVYHFVLCHSNWETGMICHSESSASLSEGLQNALWKLGGVPRSHQTDCLTAAVKPGGGGLNPGYKALLAHYGLDGRHTNAYSPHENGKVEQRHHRLKRSLEQALLLRGSRDFDTRQSYESFLAKHFDRLNRNRGDKLSQELDLLRPLPRRRLDSARHLKVKVRRWSTIRVDNNTYSVPSRLIGQTVDVAIHMDHLEVRYAQRLQLTLPRLRSEGRHQIDYRHVIETLVRKPGAFTNYSFRSDLFPTLTFRQAYDRLLEHNPAQADKIYLRILQTAAHTSQDKVESVLKSLLEAGDRPVLNVIETQVSMLPSTQPIPDPDVELPDSQQYDQLIEGIS